MPAATGLTIEQLNHRLSEAFASIAQSTISAQTDVSVLAGQPLYLQSTGRLGLAQADALLRTQVCGLALADADESFSVSYTADGIVERDDWTPIIGEENLKPGSTYYLSPELAGQLTTIAPTEAGQIVASVGIALTSKQFAIELQPIILL